METFSKYYQKPIGETIFLIVKSVLVLMVLLCAVGFHCRRAGYKSRVLPVFILYIGVMTAIMVFELAWESIPLIYYTRVLSMSGQVWTYQIMVDPILKYTRHHMKIYVGIRLIYLLFIFCFFVGSHPTYGAHCTNEIIYPMCFRLLNFVQIGLFILVACNHLCFNFFIVKSRVPARDQVPEVCQDGKAFNIFRHFFKI